MKKRPLFSLVTGSLLIFSGGCGFLPGGGDGETDVSLENQETAPPAVPLAAVRPLPPVDMAALGLIPPVLPDQRLREIQPGRANPFELIPVEAKIRESVCQLDPPKPGEANGAKQDKTNGGSVTTTTTTTTPSATPSTPGTVNVSPSSTTPPPLFPNDARAVVVSGVIEIGSRPYAIVQAPGEPVARNVTVGDRLSGGRVRVKAINPFGATPNVVLEQYGDSVTRDVGAPALPPLTPPSSPTMEGSALDAEAAMEAFGQGFAQILGTMAQEMGGTVTTATRNSNTTRTVPLRGPEGDGIGYGEIRNLAVLKLAVNERGGDLINSVGVLCNAGQEALEVRRLTFQVEDATDNTILDSIQISLARPYLLQKGQKLEFDGNAPRFRGRSPQDVIVKLVDWGSQQTQTAQSN
ncbi:hypothetical protein [Synechocystis salina]|uniref:hypothetical protein n=1 Tax=Synechocystis salina TaxID=945780 RepID=UPI001D14DC0E|nr:hypothetical protein [Synechocystis salina]